MRIDRSRGRRSHVALLAAVAAVLLVAESAFAAVDWGPVRPVGAAYTGNFGGSLARSTKGTTSYNHAAYTDTLIGGDFVDDNGPYAGVYYRRGSSSGSDWGTPKRLNPTGKHADYGAVIASGRVIYGAYVTLGHWTNYDPAEDRIITLRINDNHGAASDWLTKKFTFGNRVDRPALAPWGTRGLLMTYTDADTGDIVLQTCNDLTLDDGDCTGAVIGTTSSSTDNGDGFAGYPVVAASGGTIAVAWLEASWITYVWKTTESEWSEPAELTGSFAQGLAATAKDGRFAFSWVEDDGVRLRMWSTGGLEDTTTVAELSPDATYKAGYSTAVGLTGESTVGVAFAACRRADCGGGASTGVDLRWRQSGDDGATWGSASTVASYAASSSRRINDYPSVVMTSPTKRYVMYNALNATFTKVQVLLRVGTG